MWEFAGQDGVWRPAEVPGHVHLDLLRHGLIEDPFVRQNEKLCQWVDERDWSYRCRFEWQPDDAFSTRILRFKGLDTICKVFVNEMLIAEHDSMFVPLEIEASGLLTRGQNEVRVDFRSATRVALERREQYLKEEGIPENVANFDERAFIRKAQCMFGWDWGPRLVSCGIWKPVTLLEYDGQATGPDKRVSRSTDPVQLVQRADPFGTSFQFYIGGRPRFSLGANWIPDHAFPSQVDRERLRVRLTTARDLGINMLRVWGGGVYESDAFYDLCDELGILVWQDFMFACSYYPDSEDWQQRVREEAEYQVLRLRHHRCIALWCGNNECRQVWEDGWGGKDRQPARFHGETIYHQVLKEVVEQLDPERPYVPGSPYGGDYCNSGGQGDQHYWDVWHGRGDWTHYRDSSARFCSEFGFASSPSAATWQRAGVSVEIPKEEPDARWHNKTGKPFEVFEGLVELHYPKAESLDEWSYYSQLNQRDAMREAIEHFRFSPACSGALIWQLNDCWPVESWSVLEFDGYKKAAAYELPRLFAHLLLRLELTQEGAEFHGCLQNAGQGVSGTAMLRAISIRTGETLVSIQQEMALQVDERKPIARAELVSDEPVLWVGEFGGARVVKASAKPLGIQIQPLSERASGVLVDVQLRDLGDPTNSFDPNFFTVLPGGRIPIQPSWPVQELSIRCLKYQ